MVKARANQKMEAARGNPCSRNLRVRANHSHNLQISAWKHLQVDRELVCPRKSVLSRQPTKGMSQDGSDASAKLCYYFLKNRCKNNPCKFFHPPACPFFPKGTCWLGKDCRMHHPGQPTEAPKAKAAAKKKAATKDEPSPSAVVDKPNLAHQGNGGGG